MGLMGWLTDKLWHDGLRLYERRTLALCGRQEGTVVLDCGCGDGERTMKVAKWLGASKVCGIELVPEQAMEAQRRGVVTCCGDLSNGFPLASESVDIVLSHFVIEHLFDTDNFVTEIYRVLRPGGCAVVGTENLAATHNILALLFGKQPFCMVNALSRRYFIGNSWAVNYRKKMERDTAGHVRVFAWEGLRDIFQVYGFRIEAVVGAGYHPLFGWFGALLAGLDPRHAAFLIVKARKPG